MKRIHLAALLGATLQAQSLGITLGASHAGFQTIEGMTARPSTAVAAALSYRTHGITLAATVRSADRTRIVNQGESTADTYRWSYAGARLSCALPLGFDLGVEARREALEAVNALDGTTVTGRQTRTWARLAWEYEVKGRTSSSAFGLAACAAKRMSYDPAATYAPAEALRVYAPNTEFQAFVTVRF